MVELSHGHTPKEIAQRLAMKPTRSYLRDLVYGGIDGAVTTFAVVSGVSGAHLSLRVIIILGLANVFADGFSMAASNFLGTHSEKEEYQFYADYEEKQIDNIPQGETEEIRQILLAKGFTGETLEDATRKITSDRKLWVEFMVQEEYGLSKILRSPWKAAFVTFAAFMICGLVPLMPFSFQWSHPFLMATVLTGIMFVGIGSLKSRWSVQPWWKSALLTLLVGAAASGIAYVVGTFFR